MFLVALIMLMAIQSVRADFPITSCQSLATPGTYVLLNDIVATASPCFSFDADSITLDCNGHLIDGNNSASVAVHINGRNGAILRECRMEGFTDPSRHTIEIDSSNNVSILNNILRNNAGIMGRRFDSSSTNVLVSGNTFNSTYVKRIDYDNFTYLQGAGLEAFGDYWTIENNYFFNTSYTYWLGPCPQAAIGWGIVVNGNFATIRNNQLVDNSCGIHLAGSNGLVENNIIDGTHVPDTVYYYKAWGLWWSDGSNSAFSGNTVISAPTGFSYEGSSQGISGAQILSNSFDDFFLDGNDNLIANNFFPRNANIGGFQAYHSHDNIVQNNTFNSSAGYAQLGGYGTRFENNFVRYPLVGNSAYYPGNNNNHIIGNTFLSGISYNGLSGSDITNNTISGGLPIDSYSGAMKLLYPSGVTICNNRILNTDTNGISLYSPSSSVICGNYIEGSAGAAVHIYSGSGTTIRSNIFQRNAFGLNFVSTEGNLIYNNLFNNTRNIQSPTPASNNWYIVKTPGTNVVGGPYLAGNYWSDYEGFDVNFDGIGDTKLPYNANGSIAGSGDALPLTIYPSPYMCGDLNSDGQIDVVDVVSIVNIAFRGGTLPVPSWVADINGDGVVSDILDVVSLINHAFRGAPVPTCFGSANSAYSASVWLGSPIKNSDGTYSYSLYAVSPIQYAGAQFTLALDSKTSIVSASRSGSTTGLNLYAKSFGSEYRVGLVDFDGESGIPAGSNQLLTVKVSSLLPPTSSSLRISSATVSDLEGKMLRVSIAKTYPKTLSLPMLS